MADVFSSPTRINMSGGGYGVAQYGDDSTTVAVFYPRSVEDGPASLAAGRKICRTEDYVKIHHPGERLNQIDRPATQQDKWRFARQWQQYQLNHTQVPDGTPVDLLFPNNPSVADNLRGVGVYTVEQLSELSAHGMDTIGMGGQEYVTKAKKYLANANKGANFHQINAQMAEKDQQIKIQGQQIILLKQQVDGLIQRLSNPGAASLQPPWQPGFDAQAQRINANHPTNLAVQQATQPVIPQQQTAIAQPKVKSVRGKEKAAPAVEAVEEIVNIENDNSFDIGETF